MYVRLKPFLSFSPTYPFSDSLLFEILWLPSTSNKTASILFADFPIHKVSPLYFLSLSIAVPSLKCIRSKKADWESLRLLDYQLKEHSCQERAMRRKLHEFPEEQIPTHERDPSVSAGSSLKSSAQYLVLWFKANWKLRTAKMFQKAPDKLPEDLFLYLLKVSFSPPCVYKFNLQL